MKKIVKYKLKLFCTSFYPMGPFTRLRLWCASHGSTHPSMTWYTLHYFWKNPQPLIVRSAVRWKLKPPSIVKDKVVALPLIPHTPFPLIHFDRVLSLVFSVVSAKHVTYHGRPGFLQALKKKAIYVNRWLLSTSFTWVDFCNVVCSARGQLKENV